jgi:hypothetical protein
MECPVFGFLPRGVDDDCPQGVLFAWDDVKSMLLAIVTANSGYHLTSNSASFTFVIHDKCVENPLRKGGGDKRELSKNGLF